VQFIHLNQDYCFMYFRCNSNYLHLYKPLESISKKYNRKTVDTMVG